MELKYYIISLLATMICIIAGHKLAQVLPGIHSLFDRKPFCCRPCLTFHMVWMSLAAISFLAGSGVLLLCGIAVAFAIFFLLRYIDNKKIIP